MRESRYRGRRPVAVGVLAAALLWANAVYAGLDPATNYFINKAGFDVPGDWAWPARVTDEWDEWRTQEGDVPPDTAGAGETRPDSGWADLLMPPTLAETGFPLAQTVDVEATPPDKTDQARVDREATATWTHRYRQAQATLYDALQALADAKEAADAARRAAQAAKDKLAALVLTGANLDSPQVRAASQHVRETEQAVGDAEQAVEDAEAAVKKAKDDAQKLLDERRERQQRRDEQWDRLETYLFDAERYAEWTRDQVAEDEGSIEEVARADRILGSVVREMAATWANATDAERRERAEWLEARKQTLADAVTAAQDALRRAAARAAEAKRAWEEAYGRGELPVDGSVVDTDQAVFGAESDLTVAIYRLEQVNRELDMIERANRAETTATETPPQERQEAVNTVEAHVTEQVDRLEDEGGLIERAADWFRSTTNPE